MDSVIDTNVLLVASAADPYSPFGDSHVPIDQQQVVFNWLAEFSADSGRKLVLDESHRIIAEYRKKMGDQDYGLRVVFEKLQDTRWVVVEWDAEVARVPDAVRGLDLSDRKFVAAALTDRHSIAIVNATDSDWLEHESETKAVGVTVVHVIEPWLRSTWRAAK